MFAKVHISRAQFIFSRFLHVSIDKKESENSKPGNPGLFFGKKIPETYLKLVKITEEKNNLLSTSHCLG